MASSAVRVACSIASTFLQTPRHSSLRRSQRLWAAPMRRMHLAPVNLFGFGRSKLPSIVKAGDPVLHEPAEEIAIDDVKSDEVQKIVDQMVEVMRQAPGVGLSATQIGVPLQIIVLEDTEEYIRCISKEEAIEQDRHAFDLLVIINPKLKAKSERSARFFEGCLSVGGYRGLVERYLDVEVNGLDRNGLPLKVDASGWQARILQHECDHLAGTIYVDKVIPRTFRTVNNLSLPIARGCPQPGVCENLHRITRESFSI